MPAKLTEIRATYSRERPHCRWGETCLIECWISDGGTDGEADADEDLTIKLDCEPNELIRNCEYRFFGRWHDHPKYGRQFHAQSFVQSVPASRAGVIAYLQSHAVGCKGIGPAKCKALWECFGERAVETLREQPDEAYLALNNHRGVTPEAIRQWSANLQREAEVESCMLDLMELLSGKGFYKSTPREVIRLRGNRGAMEIRRDPYKLMTWGIRGCGFRKCDKLYADLGLPPGRLKRQALAAWYAVARSSEGHTWFPATAAEKGISATVSGAVLRPELATRLAIRARYLAELWSDGAAGPISCNGRATVRWVAWGRKADNERELAGIVAGMMGGEARWPA